MADDDDMVSRRISDQHPVAQRQGGVRVDPAGQRWPDGWVKGEGFVRPPDEADPLKAPPRFVDIGEEYVRQHLELPEVALPLTVARWSSPARSPRSTSPTSRTG